MSTQPSAMLLHKNKIVMKCQKDNPKRKPYKKIRITPPTQMQNKWYFQKEIAHTALLQTMTTAASLDRMFLHADAVSSTIGFTSLNTTEFQNHMFQITTTGYNPIHNEKLFVSPHATSLETTKFLH